MNWNNKTVLKFLKLYQNNSCIWDPQDKFHKDRQYVNDAWINIKQNMGLDCSIEDLKRKKESLMAGYRRHRNKIKKSETSGDGSNDIYQPSWFAFSTMDSFLGSVYKCNATTSTEDEETIDDKSNVTITDPLEDQEFISVTPTRAPTPPVREIQNPPELVEAKKHMERAFKFMKRISEQQPNPKNVEDECTIFGQLIASKMRKLSEERRDIMMVKINQLFVDEYK